MKPIYAICAIVNYGGDNDLLILGYVRDENKAVSVIKDYLKNEFGCYLDSDEELELFQWREVLLEERGIKVGFGALKNLEVSLEDE